MIPVMGILVFVGLYAVAASLYPGGSQANLQTEGFDWVHNYWCNLLNEKAMNGQPNPGRSMAITAMVVLCMSLMVFFLQFAHMYPQSTLWKRIIQVNGVLSMTFACLIFTSYHDLMTLISSVFGLWVVVGIMKEIYQSELTLLKISGALCIFLLILNNYIYYTTHGLEALPLLQKFTFAAVLAWVIGLAFVLMGKHTSQVKTIGTKP